MNQEKIILAIETSCDETAAAVLTGDITSEQPSFEMLSSVVRTQIDIHAKTGGVIPEVAARQHMLHIRPVVEKALSDAAMNIDDIDYVAVTAGPGLIVSLIVGVEFAKALSYASGKPLLAVNHMDGHLYSAFGQNQKSKIKNQSAVEFPILSMIVSGGHTLLVVMKDYAHYAMIGSTVDDAAGEAFDKVAKLLGLPYPGGPAINKIAMNHELRIKDQGVQSKTKLQFPRPMIHQDNYDFSFSGLKTAVRNYIKEILGKPDIQSSEAAELLSDEQKGAIALGFQEAVIDVLVTKAMRACDEYGCKTLSLSGGVAADKGLRAALNLECEKRGLKFIVPDFELCTDNAQMIAIAAYFHLKNGGGTADVLTLQANPNWEI